MQQEKASLPGAEASLFLVCRWQTYSDTGMKTTSQRKATK
jgi:hypothetical protein